MSPKITPKLSLGGLLCSQRLHLSFKAIPCSRVGSPEGFLAPSKPLFAPCLGIWGSPRAVFETLLGQGLILQGLSILKMIRATSQQVERDREELITSLHTYIDSGL